MSSVIKKFIYWLFNSSDNSILANLLIKYREKVRYLKVCNVNDAHFLMDVESAKTVFHANTVATKEPHTIEWIDKYFSKGDEIGRAHV